MPTGEVVDEEAGEGWQLRLRRPLAGSSGFSVGVPFPRRPRPPMLMDRAAAPATHVIAARGPLFIFYQQLTGGSPLSLTLACPVFLPARLRTSHAATRLCSVVALTSPVHHEGHTRTPMDFPTFVLYLGSPLVFFFDVLLRKRCRSAPSFPSPFFVFISPNLTTGRHLC